MIEWLVLYKFRKRVKSAVFLAEDRSGARALALATGAINIAAIVDRKKFDKAYTRIVLARKMEVKMDAC